MLEKEQFVTEAMLADLPDPVRRYLTYTGVVGQPWINTVHLHYRGVFRLGADKPWMPMWADQVYTTNPPGLQWQAQFKLFGLPLMFGQDTYKDGQGHMFGKLAGLITVFDASDDKLLQGTMLRYLQEITWFPVAFLSDYITWTAIDDHAAEVTYTQHGQSVSARMYFDDTGRLLSFVAERYREQQGAYSLDTWAAPVTEYAEMAGLRLPVGGWGVWQLADGDLPYVKIRLTALAYNVPIREF
jgi:hypothetical protein